LQLLAWRRPARSLPDTRRGPDHAGLYASHWSTNLCCESRGRWQRRTFNPDGTDGAERARKKRSMIQSFIGVARRCRRCAIRPDAPRIRRRAARTGVRSLWHRRAGRRLPIRRSCFEDYTRAARCRRSLIPRAPLINLDFRAVSDRGSASRGRNPWRSSRLAPRVRMRLRCGAGDPVGRRGSELVQGGARKPDLRERDCRVQRLHGLVH